MFLTLYTCVIIKKDNSETEHKKWNKYCTRFRSRIFNQSIMSHFHAVIFGEKMNSVSQYVGLNKVHDHMIRIDTLYILYVEFLPFGPCIFGIYRSHVERTTTLY